MEVLTSKNRVNATTFLSLYFSKNVITGLLSHFLWSGRYTTFRRSFYYLLSHIEFYSVLCVPTIYVFQRHFHALGTAFIIFLFTSHTFSTHFLDYIPFGKNLSSYSHRTSVFNNPGLERHSDTTTSGGISYQSKGAVDSILIYRTDITYSRHSAGMQ